MFLVKNIVYLCNFLINQTILKFKVYLEIHIVNCFSLIQFLQHFVTLDIFVSQSPIPTALPLKTVATSKMLKRYKTITFSLQWCTLNLINYRRETIKKLAENPNDKNKKQKNRVFTHRNDPTKYEITRMRR